MLDAQGTPGVLFDDQAYSPYGVKLMSNFEFLNTDGEPEASGAGYVSPGHNSAYYDAKSGQYYLIFHTRFPGRGEEHEVRVHQMFMNKEGWPVVAPHRYSGEKIGEYRANDIIGKYKLVNHGKEITERLVQSQSVELTADGKITGAATGIWKLSDKHTAELAIDGAVYSGVFLREWNEATSSHVMTFTAVSEAGISVWGSQVSVEK